MLINEVARLAGMSKDGVRHYEKMGLISSKPKQAGSKTYRDYDTSVVELIEKIRQAQQLGLSLAEIKPYIENYRSIEPTMEEKLHFLEQRLVIIRGKISDLRHIERFIVSKIDTYRFKD